MLERWISHRRVLKKIQKDSLINLFDKLYILENSFLASSKKTNEIAFEVSTLLNKVTENQQNLKKILIVFFSWEN